MIRVILAASSTRTAAFNSKNAPFTTSNKEIVNESTVISNSTNTCNLSLNKTASLSHAAKASKSSVNNIRENVKTINHITVTKLAEL